MPGKLVVYRDFHLQGGARVLVLGKEEGDTTQIFSSPQSGQISGVNLRASEKATVGLDEHLLICSVNLGLWVG